MIGWLRLFAENPGKGVHGEKSALSGWKAPNGRLRLHSCVGLLEALAEGGPPRSLL